MKVVTKKQLFRKLDNLSEDYFKLGLLVKELKLSLESRQEKYTIKEMKELIKGSNVFKQIERRFEDE